MITAREHEYCVPSLNPCSAARSVNALLEVEVVGPYV